MIQTKLSVLFFFLLAFFALAKETTQLNVTTALDKEMIDKLSKIGRDTSKIKKPYTRQVNVSKKSEKFLIDLEEIDNFDNFINNRNGKSSYVDLNQLNSLFDLKNGQIKQPYSDNLFTSKNEPIKKTRGHEQMTHIYQSLITGDEPLGNKDINTIRHIPCVKGKIMLTLLIFLYLLKIIFL
jgi:hypothetical protein